MDFSQIFSQAQEKTPNDPITKHLVSSTPDLKDIGDALMQSLSQPISRDRRTFGEVLNSVRGARIKEAATRVGAEQAQQRIGQEDRRIAAAEHANQLKALEMADKQSYGVFKDFVKRHKLGIEDEQKLFTAIDQLPEEVTAKNLPRVLADVASRMGIKGGTDMGDPSAPMKNYGYREELVKKYGEGSEQVRRFDSYVRAPQIVQLGDRASLVDPTNPSNPALIGLKGVAPKSEIDVKNRTVVTAGGASGADLATGRGPTATTTPLPETPVQTQGRGNLANIVQSAAQNYMDLRQYGGIIDPEQSWDKNLFARMKASGAGQAVQNALGTDEQVIRSRITMQRPTMINAIRQATGMGVRALDTDKELQFYLQMVSDPTVDIISNLAALDVMDRTYGNGMALQQILPRDMLDKVRNRADKFQAKNPIPSLDALKRRAIENPADADAQPLVEAREAIARGAPREAVMKRLEEMGIPIPADF